MTATPLVRDGQDTWLPKHKDKETGDEWPAHTLHAVYAEMLLQICRDYSGLPDARTLSMAQIRFYYNGLRPELRKHSRE